MTTASGGSFVWRVVHQDLAEYAFSGEGARRHGGRWNSVGKPAVYVSESLALAVMETFVHIQDWKVMRDRFRWFRLQMPSKSHEKAVLPVSWKEHQNLTQAIGDDFLAGGSALGLRIPSIVLPDSHNLLLSLSHPEYAQLKPEGPFVLPLDGRL